MKRRLSSGRALKGVRLLLEGGAMEEEEDDAAAAAVAVAATATAAAKQQQQQQQQRPMSNEQLSAMYANVIRLCAQNRVTPQNAWSLKLIDHIDAVLDQPQQQQQQQRQQHRQPAAAVSPPLPLPPPSVPPAAAADAATRRGGRGAAARGGDEAASAATTTNFQLASCTLDASALIYSARVDSVHRTAYEVLGGLSHASEKHRSAAADAADDADAAEADEDAEDAAADALLLGGGDDDGGSAGAAAAGGDATESGAKGGEQRAPRQRKAHVGAVETLDTPENLCAKHAEPAADDDPLFRKVSAALNAGGCRGLLLNNLCAVHGTQIALESAALPDADPPPVDADADTDEMLDAASVAGFLTGPDVEAMQICAVIHDYRLNGPASSASSAAVTLKAEPLLPLDDSDDDGGAATTAVEPSDAPGADDACGMFGDDCAGCGPLAFDAGEDVDEADDAQPVPLATTLDDGDVQAARNEFSFFDPKLLRNWAGPDHWKFPSKKKKPAQQSTNGTGTKAGGDSNEANEEEGGGEEEEEKGRAHKRQRRKEEPLIDFTAPAKIDRKLFDPPAKAATTLSDAALRRHTAQATTLPPDVHYDVSMLSRLFLNPSWRITERRARAPTAVAASVPSVLPDSQPAASQEWYEYHNPTADDGNEEDDDPDGDAAGDTDFGMAAAAGGDFDDDGGAEQRLEETQGTAASGARAPVLSTLVALPQHVQQVSIGYARAIRRMDVAAVKAALWRALTRVTADHPDEMPQRERRRPFRSLLEALPALLPPAILAELSVAFCFVCLLHLCNEKGLRLEGGGSSELVVLLK